MNIPDSIDFANADFIDSRDIIERINYLANTEDPDELEELETLIAFRDEVSPYASDWEYGETIVADDYFTEYARQMAEDIGAIDRDAEWPARHIDWDAAADELKQDYSEIDYDGRTWWTR